MDALRTILKEEGLRRGLYTGLGPFLLRVVTANIVTWTVYETYGLFFLSGRWYEEQDGAGEDIKDGSVLL